MPSDLHPMKRVLKRTDWTQARLARRLDMNESLISHMLAGRRPVPDDFYQRVAEVLGVGIDEITPHKEPGAAQAA